LIEASRHEYLVLAVSTSRAAGMRALKDLRHPDVETAVSELILEKFAVVVVPSPSWTLPVPIRAYVRTEDRVLFVVIPDDVDSLEIVIAACIAINI
jgi:hypothetical protein